MNPLNLLPLLFLLSVASFAGPATTADWEFSLSAGPGFRQTGSLGFTGGSNSSHMSIPSFVGGNSLIVPSIGDPGIPADRYYADGFVLPDASTHIDGLTGYWGYQNSGQVDIPGDTIRFHATGSQSVRNDVKSLRAAPIDDEDQRTVAPVINFEARSGHEIAGGGTPGFSASLSWAPVEVNRQWNDFNLKQRRDDYEISWTDTYNLGGYGLQVPQAPYSGTYLGPGFLIENIPDSRDSETALVGSEEAVLQNQVTSRFRADHTTLSFGPTLTQNIGSDCLLQLGTGVSLHWLHWSAEQHERLHLRQGATVTRLVDWNHASSGDRILGGIYFQIQGEWAPADSLWSVKSLIRAEIGQSLSSQVGPSRYTYDTDGFTAAAMLSYQL